MGVPGGKGPCPTEVLGACAAQGRRSTAALLPQQRPLGASTCSTARVRRSAQASLCPSHHQRVPPCAMSQACKQQVHAAGPCAAQR